MIIDSQGDAVPADLPLELLEQSGIRTCTCLREVGSTNSFALERLATEVVQTPWLVIAESQTSGRGRGENRWWSEQGALTFTLVVDANELNLPQSHWPRLSMGVGLAICQLLERSPWSLPMQLKWPNDVYVNGRKLAGILIEHLGPKLVIGIGLNVNQRFENAPEEVKERATSLLIEMQSECQIWLLQVDIVKQILAKLIETAAEEIDFASELEGRNYLLWKKVRIRQGNLIKEGTCVGIDCDGALLIQSGDRQERVLSGSVELGGQ